MAAVDETQLANATARMNREVFNVGKSEVKEASAREEANEEAAPRAAVVS